MKKLKTIAFTALALLLATAFTKHIDLETKSLLQDKVELKIK